MRWHEVFARLILVQDEVRSLNAVEGDVGGGGGGDSRGILRMR